MRKPGSEFYILEAAILSSKIPVKTFPSVIPMNIDSSIIIEGNSLDVLRQLKSSSVQAVVTSPPYWGVRDYGIDGQIGLEPTIDQYLHKLLSVFAELKRVLKDDGVLWVNIGDAYTSGNRGYRYRDYKNPARAMNCGRPDTPDGLKKKDLIGIPWKLAFLLQSDGWYLRSDIIWHKPNAMPESVKDRPVRSHEYIFMLTKSEKYYYDYTAVLVPGITTKTRRQRTVWDVNTTSFSGEHYATFPKLLILPCVFSSTKPDDFILDPFFGSGTLGVVCNENCRNFIGIELNPNYVQIAADRLNFESKYILKLVS